MTTKSTVFGAALAVSGLLCFTALSAASEVQITISGVGGPTTVLTLPETPTPSLYSANSFTLVPVEQLTNGIPAADAYTFYDISAGGGLSGGPSYEDSGAQLFSGPESNPILRTGSFTEENANGGDVDIINMASIPEVSTWSLILAGFAGLALTTHHRRAHGHRCRLAGGAWADEV